MTEETIRRTANALAVKTFWIRLVAILFAINAVLTALTVVGLLIAWLPAWIAYVLWKAADGVQNAAGGGEAAELEASLRHLGTYFTILGVLIIIGMLFALAMFTLGIGAAVLGV